MMLCRVGLGSRVSLPFLTSQIVRCKSNANAPEEFWKDISQKYFPALPPLQHLPEKHTFIPKSEREDNKAQYLPEMNVDFQLNVRLPKLLSHYQPVKPKPAPVVELHNGKASGVGKRKTARALAFIRPGTGQWYINNEKTLLQYFQPYGSRDIVLHPYIVTESLGLWDTWVKVEGGGVSAQAEAIRMAVSRAMNAYDSVYGATLRKAGFFRRDTRVVERKKPGQKGARRKFQWVKR